MAELKGLLGDTRVIKDEAVAISMERYDELIKKEAFFDKLMEGKGINIYLYAENVGGTDNA